MSEEREGPKAEAAEAEAAAPVGARAEPAPVELPAAAPAALPEPAAGEPAPELVAEVDKLLRAGEHAAAAAVYKRTGHLARAAEIYEQLFEHDVAIELFERAGDLRAAMRVALAARDEAAVDRIVVEATHAGQAQSLLKMLERSGRSEEIGKIHQSIGDLEAAAIAFEAAGRYARAASCRAELGDLRSAGVLYERYLEENPGEPDASVRLGRILARFSRYDDAIELMQQALRSAADPVEMLGRAAPPMILSFLQIGYPTAAEEVVRRWRASGAPDAPASLEAFLASERATALAAQMAAPTGPASSGRKAPAGLDAFFGGDEGPAVSGPRPQVGAPSADDDEEAAGEDASMLLGGRYLLGEPLGGGGVGQVFRAYDALMDRPVAVKIFGSQAMASDAVLAYAREARAAAALDHVAVTPIVELNMAQGYVVTAFVEGQTVEERLQEGGRARWLIPFTRAVLHLLGTCHRVGLVHGALKPTNLFLVAGGIRVVDFGAHHLLALRSTETGGLASVWPYLAPEQLFGAPPDVSADLYALGAILYRGLTGRPPFSRPEEDRRAAPPPPSTVRPELAGAWDAFFAQALAPARADRFVDARSMAEALPPLAETYELPQAASLSGETPAPVALSEQGRYEKGALVFRDRAGLRVYEGHDTTVGRAVWIVEVDDAGLLEPFKAAAPIGRGVQPVYDVLPDALRVVVARDAQSRRFDLAAARRVPQGLARDLASVAFAIERLHEQGYALGGLDENRLVGPVGPRLRLAPAPAPRPVDEAGKAADWQGFEAYLEHVFALDPAPSVPTRTRLAGALERDRLLDRAEAAALEAAQDAPWSGFLEEAADRLVKGAQGRVIARLAVNVLRGG